MATVTFTPNLERHLQCPPMEVSGETVRAVLTAVLQRNERLRHYIFDDQERIREHVVIFVDGHPVSDRVELTDRVRPEGEVYVMQALSGGQSADCTTSSGKGVLL